MIKINKHCQFKDVFRSFYIHIKEDGLSYLLATCKLVQKLLRRYCITEQTTSLIQSPLRQNKYKILNIMIPLKTQFITTQKILTNFQRMSRLKIVFFNFNVDKQFILVTTVCDRSDKVTQSLRNDYNIISH